MRSLIRKIGIAFSLLKLKLFDNPFMKLRMFVSDVKMGKGCMFYGLTYIEKHPNSSIKVGDNCTFRSTATSNRLGLNHGCILATNHDNAIIEIGANCGFSGTAISCTTSIVLGDGVKCGANSVIMDTDGHPDDDRTTRNMPIIIEDNVWLGVGVTVMKGSKIGRNALIGAGSIIRSQVPPYSIVIGNPAKVIGFSKTPSEIVEYEKEYYDVANRLPLELLEKNYNKFFKNRIKEIKDFVKL